MRGRPFTLWASRAGGLDSPLIPPLALTLKWLHARRRGSPTPTYLPPRLLRFLRKSGVGAGAYLDIVGGGMEQGEEADALSALFEATTFGAESFVATIEGDLVRVEYLNAGDPWQETLLRVGYPRNEYCTCAYGPWEVGCWGDWAGLDERNTESE